MQYFIINMIDQEGNELIEMLKFPSLDEARAHTSTPSFASVYKGCNITNVSVWTPGAPPLFRFEATDSEGRLIVDEIHAPTQLEAEEVVKRMGYTITSFETVTANNATD